MTEKQDQKLKKELEKIDWPIDYGNIRIQLRAGKPTLMMAKEVRCAFCGWRGSLGEAYENGETIMVEEGLDSEGDMMYEEDTLYKCPKCNKDGLEVYENNKKLGSMLIYG